MTLSIDRDASEPVYAQIARQVRDLVSGGDLRPGHVLPSVRALASDLGVNLNTVARAYRQLADEGFVRIRDRTGVEVIAPRRRPDGADRRRFGVELRRLLARMRQAGMEPIDLRDAAREEIDRLLEDERA